MSRRLWISLVVLGVLVVGGLVGWPHAFAWYHFRAGRAAVENYHTAEAREHLDRCLKVWPTSVDAHFLAARAARRAGAFDEAREHLSECQRLTGDSTEDIALESALLDASMGNLAEVEKFLVDQVNASPRNARLIWEGLAEGYIRMYRVLDALASVNRWLQVDPDNIRALTLRGDTHWKVGAVLKTVPDYTRVIELDPEQNDVRWRLSLGLLETGLYTDALKHLEELARRKPNDIEVRVRLARCQYVMGQRAQARKLLASILADNPEHGTALRTRGQINRMDGQLEEAEEDLRKAIRIMPNDHPSHWELAQVLQRLKKDAEAKEMSARAEKIKANHEKLQELSTQKMSVRPNDPALHCEMGKLLLSMGHSGTARLWFQSALEIDENYGPAHAALADYYQGQGDKENAERHRRLARDR